MPSVRYPRLQSRQSPQMATRRPNQWSAAPAEGAVGRDGDRDHRNDLLARQEQAIGEMRQFSAALAHELRTPLAVLRGETELALVGQIGAQFPGGLVPRGPVLFQGLENGLIEFGRHRGVERTGRRRRLIQDGIKDEGRRSADERVSARCHFAVTAPNENGVLRVKIFAASLLGRHGRVPSG